MDQLQDKSSDTSDWSKLVNNPTKIEKSLRYSIDSTSDGQRVAIGTSLSIYLIQTKTGNIEQIGDSKMLNDSVIWQVQFSPDNSLIAGFTTLYKHLKVFKVNTKQLIHKCNFQPLIWPPELLEPINCIEDFKLYYSQRLCFSLSNQLTVILDGGKNIVIVNPTNPTQYKLLKMNHSSQAIAYSDKSEIIYTVGKQWITQISNLSCKICFKIKITENKAPLIKVYHDMVAISSQNSLKQFDMKKHKLLRQFKYDLRLIFAMAFSSNNLIIYGSVWDHFLSLNITNGQLVSLKKIDLNKRYYISYNGKYSLQIEQSNKNECLVFGQRKNYLNVGIIF